jgi:hypothetical protein
MLLLLLLCLLCEGRCLCLQRLCGSCYLCVAPLEVSQEYCAAELHADTQQSACGLRHPVWIGGQGGLDGCQAAFPPCMR